MSGERYDITIDKGGDLIAELLTQKAALVTYLLSKVRAEDWHAVQDAGSDIREIVAQIDLLRTL